MPAAARLGDKAQTSADAHGCPACPHAAIGPVVQGSPDVFINGRPAARYGDPGVHSSCCGANTFTIAKGSPTVYVNGKPLARMNDSTKHCGGTGPLTEGSPDVLIDDGAASATGLAASAFRSSSVLGQQAKASAPGQTTRPAKPGQPASQGPAAQQWVEFRFRDAGGRALPGVRYRITLPSGNEVRGKLDGQGTARHDQLPEGTASGELADVDAATWDAQEIDAHESVELSVETSGLDAGEPVQLEIFRLYRERAGQAVATLHATLDANGQATATWTPSSIERPEDSYLFKATAGGTWRKSAPLVVRHRATACEWSRPHAREGDEVRLRAELRGVGDGEKAKIVVWQKRWRDKQDERLQQLEAAVSDGAIEARWIVPSGPRTAGDRERRDLYFTVEAGPLQATSGLLAVDAPAGHA